MQEQISEGLNRSVKALQNRLDERVDLLASVLQERIKSCEIGIEKLQSRGDNKGTDAAAVVALPEIHEGLSGSVKALQDQLDERVDARVNILTSTLFERIQYCETGIEKLRVDKKSGQRAHVAPVRAEISEGSSRNIKALGSRLDQRLDSLASTLDESVKSCSRCVEKLETRLDERVDSVAATLHERIAACKRGVEELYIRTEEKSTEMASELPEAFAVHVEKQIAARLEERGKESAEGAAVVSVPAEIREDLSRTCRRIQTQLDETIHLFTSTLNMRVESCEIGIENVETRSNQKSEEVAAEFKEAITALDKQVTDRLDERLDSFASTLHERIAPCEIGVEKLESQMDKTSTEILSREVFTSYIEQIAGRLQSVDNLVSQKAEASLVEHLVQQYSALLGSAVSIKSEVDAYSSRIRQLEEQGSLDQSRNCTLTNLMETVHPLKLQLHDLNTILLSKMDSAELSSLNQIVQELQARVQKLEQAPKVQSVEGMKKFQRTHDVAGRSLQQLSGLKPVQKCELRAHSGMKPNPNTPEEHALEIPWEVEEFREVRIEIQSIHSMLKQKAGFTDLHHVSATVQNLSDSIDREVEQKTEHKMKGVHGKIFDHLERLNGKWKDDFGKLRDSVSFSERLELSKLRNYVESLNAKSRDELNKMSDRLFDKADLVFVDQLSKHLKKGLEDRMDELTNEHRATSKLLDRTIERASQAERNAELLATSLDGLAQVVKEPADIDMLSCFYTALPPPVALEQEEKPRGPPGEFVETFLADEARIGHKRRVRHEDWDDLIAGVARKAERAAVEKLAREIERIGDFLMLRFPQFRAPQSAGPRKYLNGPMSEYKGEFKTAGPRRVAGPGNELVNELPNLQTTQTQSSEAWQSLGSKSAEKCMDRLGEY